MSMQAHHKTCEALEREEAARREAERQTGAELSALTAQLSTLSLPVPVTAMLGGGPAEVCG